MTRAFIGISIAALVACGGSQNPDDENIGQTTQSGGGTNPADDLDVENDDTGQGGDKDGGLGGTGSKLAPDVPPKPTGPAFTFVLKNTHDKDLAFNMDYGWGANVQMYSGEPPKAVSILPFETFCTAACGSADQCPKCTQPQKLGQIKKAQKIETVAPGESLSLEWDGQVHAYEKVKGKCKCFKKEPAPAATYKFRVCGLRLTKSAKKRSQLQCSEPTEVTIPADGPQTVELEFGAPPGAKKKSKKKSKKKKR